MKRLLDVLVSGSLLLLLSPLLVVLAVLTAWESPGGAFFRQIRVGRGGETFGMLKFRSMVADAESRGPHFTAAGDPRITRMGAFLRKTSLDELPQLWNVLRGDMSLVGPRPDVPAQRELYTDDEWERRHRVRPGITGLAQATKRGSATVEERKALDLEYAANAGLIFDIKILWWTVGQVLFKGSH